MTRAPRYFRAHYYLAIFAVVMLLWGTTAVVQAQEGDASNLELTGRWGVGLEAGMMKPVHGEWDYSTLDQFAGIHFRKALSDRWNLAFAIQYGYVRPGAEQRGDEVGFDRSSGAPLYTTFFQPTLKLQHRFLAGARFSPVFGFGLGATRWKVVNKDGEDVGAFPGGDAINGYDTDGNLTALEGTDFTILFELGLDVALNSNLYLNLGARYELLLGNDKDNAGMSFYWGPEHVDANTGLAAGYLGLTWWFGAADRDGDGVANDRDQCPDEAEDRDGYDDSDGCPDYDNDQDGVLDDQDLCPTTAEDRDGFQDDDGCPDQDNDGDDVLDTQDGCPDQAEDFDGWQDQDGCPDPDNDQDGVPDERDQCPATAAAAQVDENGCAITVPTVSGPTATATEPTPTRPAVFVPAVTGDEILEGVNFVSGSAELTPASITVLLDLANTLRANPALKIEIRGHTDSMGGSAANQALSQKRATSVRRSLVQMGIPADRVTAAGFGEDYPIANNATRAGRARNRRVEIHRK